jgi:hypothetical protein
VGHSLCYVSGEVKGVAYPGFQFPESQGSYLLTSLNHKDTSSPVSELRAHASCTVALTTAMLHAHVTTQKDDEGYRQKCGNIQISHCECLRHEKE